MSEYRHKTRHPDMRMALVLCAGFDVLASSISILDIVEWLLQEPLSLLMSHHRASKAPVNALRRHSSISVRLLLFVRFVRTVLICRIGTEVKPIVRHVGIQMENKPSHYRQDLIFVLILALT